MQALFFLKQCLVKLFHFGHIHMMPRRRSTSPSLFSTRLAGADMANTVFYGNAKFQFKGRA
ncbi:hypothetical protein ACVXG9_27550 [Escherichia coli]